MDIVQMKYIIGLVCGLLALIVLLGIAWIWGNRRRAKYLVKLRSDDEKLNDLNRAMQPFGFGYNLCQDIFYSLRDAWQRTVGYGRIFDENAVRMNMVIDCEPIYFTCRGTRYLLEIWKGQYGITTGAEIGFYLSEEETTKPPEEIFYRCAGDEEMIPMRYVLKKADRILSIRDEIHWWLTGFVLGEFSKREELEMEVSVAMPDVKMRDALLEALYETGYGRDEIFVSGLHISFLFATPKTKQPKINRLRMRWVQGQNRRNCRRYQRVTKEFVRTIDKVDYLGMCFPGLYRMLSRLGHQSEKKTVLRRGRAAGRV